MAAGAGPYNPSVDGGHARLLGFSHESCVRGELRPGGSKSLAQRALLAAALAHGTTEIEHLPDGDDVRAALLLLEDAGVPCERSAPGRVRVTGRPPGESPGLAARGPLQVGESGTLARLATAALALASVPGTRWTIAARGSLLFRRSTPLFTTLRAAGVELAQQNLPGTWPVELVSAAAPEGLELERPVSSQELSALLLAASAWPGTRTVSVRGPVPSAPYADMTVDLLQRFGAKIEGEGAGAEACRFHVRGPLQAPAAPVVLEPDASSAAVVLAAACLSRGEVRVPGLRRDSSQGDVRIVEHLAAFGCEARFDERGVSARGFPERGVELDLAGEPDLAPVLAAVAAGAALRHGAISMFAGLGTLPGKESDRLSVLSAGLRALGFAVETGTDWLRVAPGDGQRASGEVVGEVVLDARGDHRMAFAFALLGLFLPGVRVGDSGCVAKSWASFWSDLERLGARLARA